MSDGVIGEVEMVDVPCKGQGSSSGGVAQQSITVPLAPATGESVHMGASRIRLQERGRTCATQTTRSFELL